MTTVPPPFVFDLHASLIKLVDEAAVEEIMSKMNDDTTTRRARERFAARKRAVDVAWRQSGEIPVQAYTGVTCMPSERWKARALKTYVGTYDTAKEAADAVDTHYKLKGNVPIKGFNSTIPTTQQRPT